MKLYDRDYSSIKTDEEREAQLEYEVFDSKTGIKYLGEDPLHSHPSYEIRKFL